MEITFDPAKREATLVHRRLDFADAAKVFAGPTFDAADDRFDYGEERIFTAGLLAGRVVVVVWTPTDLGRRIISMRHRHEREARKWRERMV
jgi:uncharacterized DUF497 family protein